MEGCWERGNEGNTQNHNNEIYTKLKEDINGILQSLAKQRMTKRKYSKETKTGRGR